MEWVPEEMWLSYLQLEVPAGDLDYDLAISTTDGRAPSAADAGIEHLGDAGPIADGRGWDRWPVGVGVAIGLGVSVGIAVMVWRRRAVPPEEQAT